MTNDKNTPKELETTQGRLKLLVKLSCLTRDEFAKKHKISNDTLKSYLVGARGLPLEVASEFADEYGVSLDWLYCKTSFMCHSDVLICALSKLLKVESNAKKVKRNGEIYAYRERTLYMDQRLYEFLLAVQELKYIKEHSFTMPEEEYQVRRNMVIKNTNDKLKDIFSNEFQGQEIDYLELID